MNARRCAISDETDSGFPINRPNSFRPKSNRHGLPSVVHFLCSVLTPPIPPPPSSWILFILYALHASCMVGLPKSSSFACSTVQHPLRSPLSQYKHFFLTCCSSTSFLTPCFPLLPLSLPISSLFRINFPSVCLCVYLCVSAWVSVCLYMYVHMCLSAWYSVRVSSFVCLFNCLFICLLVVHLSVWIPVYLSTCPYVYVDLCLSLYACLFVCTCLCVSVGMSCIPSPSVCLEYDISSREIII